MRQISIDAAAAFHAGREFKRDNTKVVYDDGYWCLVLFDNLIAKRRATQQDFEICTAGFETVTTKDRLNALNGVSIYQKKGQWYLNDWPWDNTHRPINPKLILAQVYNARGFAA
jgi:hypothetical protein